jgi:hypothetical protein
MDPGRTTNLFMTNACENCYDHEQGKYMLYLVRRKCSQDKILFFPASATIKGS